MHQYDARLKFYMMTVLTCTHIIFTNSTHAFFTSLALEGSAQEGRPVQSVLT